MEKYAKIINNETGLCDVGIGTDTQHYISKGYELKNVEQSEIDGNWYLTNKCPHHTQEEKLTMAKNDKYQEANRQAHNFLDNIATFELTNNFHIECTKENMNTFATAAIAIEKQLLPYQEWTSKEDNVMQLDEEQCLIISMGIGMIQSFVWNTQFVAYKNRINECQTVEEVEQIEINYIQEPVE